MALDLRFGFSPRSARRRWQGVLDRIGVVPLGAYSVRRLDSNYSGACLRVRRSSDNAELDIGFAGQALDISALLGFVGAGDGFVTTWYDQSGNARNLAQSVAANQPKLVLAGAYLGGIRPDAGTLQRLSRTDSAFALHASAATIASVLGATEPGASFLGTIWALGSTSGNRIWLGTAPGNRTLAVRGSSQLAATPTQTLNASGNLIVFTKTASADASGFQTRANGSAASGYAAQAIGATDNAFMLNQNGAGTAAGFHVHRELILWGQALDAGQIGLMESSAAGYFGIALG
ncbi:arabinofuranosidase catalytic domain-containing protein [Rhabdaerophilum calidifontis]|uniref:arabinofuranosidase catalytic domain-containing protein n=1 Tax=Rhabdaerophilum calidifontis TaxID=2604328 RepID=UPI001239E439|nr:arabinofuranosidase catalytic domain-containing protein [Rhabdaerophilum calidifontis]